MTENDPTQEMLQYFRLEDADLQALGEMESVLEERADELVDAFYQHLLDFPETEKFLQDPGTRDRLLRAQRVYLMSLATTRMDAAYLAEREQIGATHERIGLDTRWYIGAYVFYFELLVPVFREALGDDPPRLERVLSALGKRLGFDAEIALRQYIGRREAELQRLNRELRSEGVALSAEVDATRTDLLQSQERARAAEQLASVATLVTGLAHEVGTPMGVIRGHAEALEGAVEGERARWRLGMILEQIDRITSIIQSLLNIARPKESLRIQVDLAETIETSLAFLTEKMRRRSVQVTTQLLEVPPVIGDPEKIQQVLLNVFINAIDAMRDGGELSVGLEQGDPGEVIIRIRDQGMGIPADQLDAIFAPFYTSKEAGHGNGLGLVVVKGIVEEHGGRIEASSEVGTGTEFVIALPSAH
jgi:signal transduction histidine kinase